MRQQDEAAGETGVPGLEKCPGQTGHPVHTGPDPVSWVGGWREPRRNSAKSLRARSDGARPACERHARGTREGGVSVYKREGCLWALRAWELCRGVGDDGTVRVRAGETLGTNSARVSAGARDRMSPTGVSARVGDRVGAARRGGNARNLLRLTLPDWLFDPERPGRGRGAKAHARARGGARA